MRPRSRSHLRAVLAVTVKKVDVTNRPGEEIDPSECVFFNLRFLLVPPNLVETVPLEAILKWEPNFPWNHCGGSNLISLLVRISVIVGFFHEKISYYPIDQKCVGVLETAEHKPFE